MEHERDKLAVPQETHPWTVGNEYEGEYQKCVLFDCNSWSLLISSHLLFVFIQGQFVHAKQEIYQIVDEAGVETIEDARAFVHEADTVVDHLSDVATRLNIPIELVLKLVMGRAFAKLSIVRKGSLVHDAHGRCKGARPFEDYIRTDLEEDEATYRTFQSSIERRPDVGRRTGMADISPLTTERDVPILGSARVTPLQPMALYPSVGGAHPTTMDVVCDTQFP